MNRRLAAACTVLGLLALPLLPGFAGAPARPSAPTLRVPKLVATIQAAGIAGGETVRAGEPVRVTGRLAVPDRAGLPATPTAGRLRLRVRDASGRTVGMSRPVQVLAGGAFTTVLPASVTRGVRGNPDRNYLATLAVEAVDVEAAGRREPLAGVAALAVAAAPTGLTVVNDFTSSRGWVKPGDSYPSRVIVRNYAAAAASNVVVTIAGADGMRFVQAAPAAGQGTATLSADAVTWTLGTVPGASDPAVPTVRTLVLDNRAHGTAQDPRVVWKDLSTVATLTHAGGTGTSTSHGPKVIPPSELYDSARFGDRPFPVVPVDYVDPIHKHDPAHSGDVLSDKINSTAVPGSTFNLWQENSFGQLYPHGTVPSAGIATADWSHTFSNPKYADGFSFTTISPTALNACHGVTTVNPVTGAPTPAGGSERIHDGWYQLPGMLDYYGDDKGGSRLVSALTGQFDGLIFDIDNACGPTGKAVYDSAHIADPEIDYSDYDTDKDGVVDFFMVVFQGLGGHGDSQLNGTPPGLDNIWPHSSSLEFTYTDTETGLTGYISDDQLKDLVGRPLWYTNEDRAQMTTEDTGEELKVYVRVGPYNVNPETAIEKASVISHEYGHSLGVPDFYSTGARSTYGDWNLMATDKSQHLDVFAKQEFGWLVPREIPKGTSTVRDWTDSKRDIHAIEWRTPSGEPYTLSGPNVHNGEAYTAKLPGRQLISPAKLAQGASPTHVWYSGSGNNYGCAPALGHNLDVYLPELTNVPAGADVQLTFKSYWEIEWDYDYGFVLISGDKGSTYTSVASQNNTTTPGALNPQSNGCQSKFGNGLTGTSGSYQANTTIPDRAQGNYPDGGFVADSFDVSALAGTEGPVIRFSYSSDPGLAKKGWFIDDIAVTVDGKPIYSSNFEDKEADDNRLFNGGCGNDETRVASRCTKGWLYVSSAEDSTADHGYYLEMRDRSGFDLDGKGENDRDPLGFAGGLLLVYTDEAHGYGNAGTDDPPAQSPLDANPQVGNSEPNLNDAAFSAGNTFSDSTHVDNYLDPGSESGNWEFHFACLGLKVLKLEGDDEGPGELTPGGTNTNLTGDVQFTTGTGCAPFNYGHQAASGANSAPVAVPQVKSRTVAPGSAVTFDGSGSYDDRDTSATLRYEWDFDADGKYDATGVRATRTFAKEGRYPVTLRVTDSAGLSSTATIVLTVAPPARGRPGTMPSTGGSTAAAVAALGCLVAAGLLRRRARG